MVARTKREVDRQEAELALIRMESLQYQSGPGAVDVPLLDFIWIKAIVRDATKR